MDNREIALKFFEFLRALVMSMQKNPDDDGELKELSYLANYIKDMVADSIDQREKGNVPVLSLTIFGSRDGKTDGRFQICRNEGIINSWKLPKLVHALQKTIDKWEDDSMEQEPDFDWEPYKLLMQETKKGTIQ